MTPAAFESTMQAALERLDAVRPRVYPDTRGDIRGAVTRLSPYLTHGFLDVPDVVRHLRTRHQVSPRHKLVFELAWREYFRHVWAHEGDAIFASLHEGPLPDDAYAREVPRDVREARTGLAVIDRAVAALYACGYLHNHARMWLASYLVHLRKVHWRAGADWLYGHLIDGDLASNHLSWQWIAGTGSHRPYLFNASNVLRYAPPDWQVAGTCLDATYAELEAIAGDASWRVESGPAGGGEGIDEPEWSSVPPGAAQAAAALDLEGRDVWLVHPWCLADPPEGLRAVAVIDTGFHARWPWSARRWRFVMERMRVLSALPCVDHADAIVKALSRARSLHGRFDPHLGPAFERLGLDAVPEAFDGPQERCRSFSTWWSRTRLSDVATVSA
jgi:deoxyribodipyrimidine photo-lyase